MGVIDTLWVPCVRGFYWLEKARAQKDIFLWTLKGDPFFKGLEGDTRYKSFLRKMNLPD